ncbi:MAG: PH domain-containing protein [Nanoarchaeota archaeon]
MKELDKVLDKKEKVLWEGKPKFWPFVISGTLALSLVGLIFLLFGIGGFLEIIESGNYFYLLLLPQFWIPVIFAFGIPIYTLLAYRNVYYAITNRRVLFQAGVIGRDFQIVDFDNITNAEVSVGIMDKLFGNTSGNIFIYTASEKQYSFLHVQNPYEVFRFFKKVSHEVKTGKK